MIDHSIFRMAAEAHMSVWSEDDKLVTYHRHGGQAKDVRAIVIETNLDVEVDGQEIDATAGTISFTKADLDDQEPTNRDWVVLADGRKFFLSGTDPTSNGMFTCSLLASPPTL